MNKSQAQKRHVQRRSAERLGYEISRETCDRLVAAIRAGRSEAAEKKTNRVSWHKVVLDGRFFEVAYDRNRHSLCTVLPRGTMR